MPRFAKVSEHPELLRSAQVPERPLQCRFAGCENAPHAHRLCAGHLKQLQRGQALAPLRTRSQPPKTGPRTLLALAAIAYADSSGDEDEARAFRELELAAEVSVKARGLDTGLDNSARCEAALTSPEPLPFLGGKGGT